MSQQIIFYLVSALIVFCSIMVISNRNPVTSAIYLIGDLFLLAGLYALLDAHFVAAIQVLVYAGAVVVLFMFVIMLLNQGPDDQPPFRISAGESFVLLLTLAAFLLISLLIVLGEPSAPSGEQTAEAIANAGGNTYAIGMHLFTKYIWPFELASLLILLAIVASVIIAKKSKERNLRGETDGTY